MEKQYKDVEEVFWKPEEEGESIEGVFKSTREDVGENKAKVYVLKKEDGELISIWGCKVLDQKMDLINIGQDIKIIYLGEKGKIRKYHDYRIQVAVAEEVKEPTQEEIDNLLDKQSEDTETTVTKEDDVEEKEEPSTETAQEETEESEEKEESESGLPTF